MAVGERVNQRAMRRIDQQLARGFRRIEENPGLPYKLSWAEQEAAKLVRIVISRHRCPYVRVTRQHITLV